MDLTQNAIYLKKDTADSKMDVSDYFLFYGQGQTQWSYNPGACPVFQHSLNLYSDTTYYFITVGNSPGKRIQQELSPSGTPSFTVTTFDDYQHSETNEGNTVNLIQSGRHWYGFNFNEITTYDYMLNIPSIDVTTPAQVNVSLIGRNSTASSYLVSVGSSTETISPTPVNTSLYYADYASPATGCFSVPNPPSSMDVNINQQTSGAEAWMEYVEVNYRRLLTMVGDQMEFRDSKSIGSGKVAQFNLTSGSPVQVWEVTDPTNVGAITNGASTQNLFQFAIGSDSLRQFIAFTGNTYYTPTIVGEIPNQNLHGLPQADVIIVTHPDFYNAAVSLANFHETNDNLKCNVVTTKEVYNEFGSGSQDVSAIRDFVRMFYDRSTGYSDLPKYLLLFGTGSYDNLYRLSNNTNYVPTYQSDNSHNPTDSYVSDDFYGLLDLNEGDWTDTSGSLVDIGIGRITVESVSDAQAVVNKIVTYCGKGPMGAPGSSSSCSSLQNTSPFGDWRNKICFIADTYPPDCDIHEQQADIEAALVDTLYPVNNIAKIYLDAYPAVGTPGGTTYPAAETAINAQVNAGAFIMNYTGHGGNLGLSHDRVLGIPDIESWNNIYNMPLFVTATCEFSTYDNPAVVSAGEDILLNHNGGGIALFSTVRLVFSSPNFTLNQIFYDSLYAIQPNGNLPRLGDLIRMTKVGAGPGVNNRNFTLLGDPAMSMAFPYYTITTDSINGDKLSGTMVRDTVRALSKCTISGHVTDLNGNAVSSYNGYLIPTIFDKPVTVTTLGSGGGCVTQFPFNIQNSVLYKGLISVTKGQFRFSFIVPKDINYQFGNGKISYYAENSAKDGNGYCNQFILGGSSKNVNTDLQGPSIKLYMNDASFVYGGTTNQNPYIYATFKDSSGINTVGNGIGHDLVAILDGNTQNQIVLNNYYQSDLNSYKSGSVHYQLSNLSNGLHTLTLKAWDVYNNPSQATTEFVVANTNSLVLSHVLNYPNPFTTNTYFYFEQNRCCELMDVQIQIFTVSGKLVRNIVTRTTTTGFRSNGIEWDGKDDFGHNIGRGVYVYHLKLRAGDGSTADKYEKLVILY